MTREEFELAKLQAINKHLDMAFLQAKNEPTERKRNNAKRRFERCVGLASKWYADGFWDTETESEYDMIYKNQNDWSAVSPY